MIGLDRAKMIAAKTVGMNNFSARNLAFRGELEPMWTLLRKIFLRETSSSFLQFVRTGAVGVLSLCVDMFVLFFLTEAGVFYLYSACVGFGAGLCVNYLLIKKYVFRKSHFSLKFELVGYLGIALIALLLTECLMFVLTQYLHLYYLVSRFVAAILVLFWTFIARKYFLYGRSR